MISALGASKIYSTLGNNNSLVPLAIKDVANSIGLTAGSYITGDKLEGKDRFIDEFGTQALWLFGIPAYKKLIDLTLYKILKIDHNFDVRNLKDKNLLKKAIEFADKSIKPAMEKAAQNPAFTKNLALSKFVVSTGLTIATYIGLTKYRHNQTLKAAEKEIIAEAQKQKENNFNNNLLSSTAFKGIHKNIKTSPAFTGALQDFMFNPQKNLMILDASITGERFADSRNKQDFFGYLIKEGTFWTFMYFASEPIKKYFEKAAETKYNKSIDLDARVIESEELKYAFENNLINSSVEKFKTLKNNEEILEYIYKNPDNFLVKMAKKSDIIPTLKKSEKIDFRKFIDYDEIKALSNKLEKLNNQFSGSQESLDEFLNSVKKLKRKSVLKNMGICIGVLGVIAPAIMVLIRKLDKNNKGFQVKEDLKKELAFNGKI